VGFGRGSRDARSVTARPERLRQIFDLRLDASGKPRNTAVRWESALRMKVWFAGTQLIGAVAVRVL